MPITTDSAPATQRPAGIDGLIDHSLEDASQADASLATPTLIPDQRRSGRLEHVSPALIPLLRNSAQGVDAEIDTDPLAPGRGIVVGLLLSATFWAVIGLAMLAWR
jgi:hypothetical protein